MNFIRIEVNSVVMFYTIAQKDFDNTKDKIEELLKENDFEIFFEKITNLKEEKRIYFYKEPEDEEEINTIINQGTILYTKTFNATI